MALLRQWARLVVANAIFQNNNLRRELLEACGLSLGFVRYTPLMSIVEALYHCHTLQLFIELEDGAAILKAWNDLSRPTAQDMHQTERLLVEHLRNRLRPDTMWSIPQEVFSQAILLLPQVQRTCLKPLMTQWRCDRKRLDILGYQPKRHDFFKVDKAV